MADVILQEILSYESVKFIDNEHVAAYYYASKNLMHIIWKQRTVGEAYRKVFIDCIEFAQNHLSTSFLSDIRNQGIVGPEDRHWFESVALPGAIDCGLQKSAVIFDGNVFKMYYINMILQHGVRKGIPMKFFRDLNSAEQWLLAL
ncbi:MAG TPA: hypothetical protein DDX98_12610 [Bacteroidales bacterium]|nr:hypothetical protein [Bacteroidales bacterium]